VAGAVPFRDEEGQSGGMFIVDVLVIVVLLFVIAIVITLGLSAMLSLPLADAVNRLLRRIGLAGPHRGSRSIGVQGTGIVDEEFRVARSGEHADGKLLVKGELWNARCALSVASTLKRGDEVEFVYNDDLSVTVLGKVSAGADR
jgi:membrane protein implicated in regulation of membrane protease activity